MIYRLASPTVFYLALVAPAIAQTTSEKKTEVIASVESNQTELIDIADQIWHHPETALREHKSSKVLADAAQRHGFVIEWGVAGMPTAFIASYGSGSPIIGILGEYDALPGLSQNTTTERDPLVPDAPGHGCGHNLFGSASLGAAIAIKDLIERGLLSGTIRFYGTPAEEAIGGKIYMARDGLFDDLDVCLAWHPSDKTQADTQSTQALVDFTV
ncbi:MAG: amidohydrolase, partial [Planctomycetes bacterium]|nr:amidohydrolase [Planctomycetota bacterium]